MKKNNTKQQENFDIDFDDEDQEILNFMNGGQIELDARSFTMDNNYMRGQQVENNRGSRWPKREQISVFRDDMSNYSNFS